MKAELASSDIRQSKATEAGFRPAWVFKGDAIPRILELLEGCPKPWVHGCCGSAVIPGEDRRIDLYHPSGEDIDMAEIDKHVQGAGAIIIDPPYPESAWDLATRQKVVSACARALKPGGRLIIHAPWQPRYPRSFMRLMEPFFLRDDSKLSFPQPPVLLCAYEKQPEYAGATSKRREWDRDNQERIKKRKKQARPESTPTLTVRESEGDE